MADDFSQIAKDFIDRANGGTGPTGTWRLEVLQKRFSPKAGREIPIRIRRFLKGIPWAQVHDAIRYLISQAPYEGIIYNGVELVGKYRPTLTQWRRDDQEQVGGNAQGSYTLIQDLIEDTDGDKLDTVSADSCSETEETTWVWDAPEIEELPYDGSQGITYAIRQVRRNEDGTFDYAIVKQVAKTKFSGWIVTECDKYSKVSVKVFDNVYGGLFDGDPFTDGTTVLQIPAPCETDDGTLVQVSVAQNPDCTFRVTVQKTEAKLNVEKTSETRKGLRGVVTSETTVATNPLPETDLDLGEQVRNELRPDGLYDVTHVTVAKESVGDIGSSCERTVFEHQHAETRNEASRPEKEASSAGGGKIYQVQSRATEEGTWDVTRTETTEIAQTGAQKTKQKTLRGVTETTVDRNVDNNDVTVTNIGDRVSVEMTPGGKYNRTVTKVSKESVGDIGSSCETTVFEHRHVKNENVATRPEKEASSAGGGKTYQVQSRATEEGTWDVSRTETTELKSEKAQHLKRKTLRGVTETYVDRNVDNSDVTVANIGDEVRVERTPGGKYNRTVTKVSKESVGNIGSSCETTVFEHRHVENENVASRPEKEASSAGGGKTYQVQSRATEEGTWDVSRTTVEEKAVTGAQHMMRKTLRGVTETFVHRNVTDSSVSVTDIGDEVRIEQTPGGLWNRTETHASHEAVGIIGKSCAITPVVHTDTVLSNVPDGSQPEPQHQSPEVNVEKTIETRRTEEGTWDVTERTATHKDLHVAETRVDVDMSNDDGTNVVKEETSAFARNLETAAEAKSEAVLGQTKVGLNEKIDFSMSLTPYGSYDLQTRKTTYNPVEYGKSQVTVEMASASGTNTVRSEKVSSSYNILKDGVDVEAKQGETKIGDNKKVDFNVRLNDHGTYDVTSRVTEYNPVKYGKSQVKVEMASASGTNLVESEKVSSSYNILKDDVDKEAKQGETKIGDNKKVDFNVRLNDHGTYDVTSRVTEYNPVKYGKSQVKVEMASASGTNLVESEKVSSSYNILKDDVDKEAKQGETKIGDNKKVDFNVRLNDHGTYDVTSRVTEYNPVKYGKSQVKVEMASASGTNLVESEKVSSSYNILKDDVDKEAKQGETKIGDNKKVDFNVRLNDHGTYDVTSRVTEYNPVKYGKSQVKVEMASASGTNLVESEKVSSSYNILKDDVDKEAKQGETKIGDNKKVDFNVRLNDHGTYDVTSRVTEYNPVKYGKSQVKVEMASASGTNLVESEKVSSSYNILKDDVDKEAKQGETKIGDNKKVDFNVRLNDHGTYDVTSRVTEYNPVKYGKSQVKVEMASASGTNLVESEKVSSSYNILKDDVDKEAKQGETKIGDNKKVDFNVRLNDHGTYDVTSRVTEYNPVKYGKSQVKVEMASASGTNLVESEKVSSSYNILKDDVDKEAKQGETKIGDNKKVDFNVRLNDHGTYDVTSRVTEYNPVKYGKSQVKVEMASASGTNLVESEKVSSSYNILKDDVDKEAKQGETKIGDNKKVDFNVRLNDHGTYDVTSRVTEYNPVKYGKSQVKVEMASASGTNLVESEKVSSSYNILKDDVDKEAKQGETKIGDNKKVDFNVRLNDHGTYDVTSRVTEYNPVKYGKSQVKVEMASASGTNLVEYEQMSSSYNILKDDVDKEAKQGEIKIGDNKKVDFNVRFNDHGTYDITSRLTKYHEVDKYDHGPTSLAELTTVDRTIHLHTLRNVVSEPSVPQPKDGWAHTGLSAQLNDHGSMDATWQEHEANKLKTWELEVTGFNYYYQKTVWFRNASEDQYQSLVNTEVSKFETKVNEWTKADRPPASVSVTPTVNDTEFVNRYNGSIVVRASWESSQAGQNGEVNCITHYAEYSYNEKVKGPGNVSRTVTKYRKITFGRGRIKFGEEWNKMILDTELRQTVSKSFTYNVNTSVWTITYDRIYW